MILAENNSESLYLWFFLCLLQLFNPVPRGCRTKFYFLQARLKFKSVTLAFFHYSKFDEKHVNDSLKQICLFYLSESTISRYHGHAKTCFEMLRICLRPDDCEPKKAMTVCCFRCLKIIVCYILSDLYFV